MKMRGFKLFFILLMPVLASAQSDFEIEGIDMISYPTLDVSLFGAGAYRLQPVVDDTKYDQDDHLRNMKTSLSYGATALYFPQEKLGFGVTYSHFQVSGGTVNNDNSFYMKEEVLTQPFIGAVCYFRQSDIGESWYYGPIIGLGYFGYNQYVNVKDDTYKGELISGVNPPQKKFKSAMEEHTYSGGTMGIMFALQVQRRIGDNFAIGSRLGFIFGASGIEGYWQDRKGSSVAKDKLSRLELGITIHYLKN